MGFHARRWIGLTGLVLFVLIYVVAAMEFGARVIDSMHGAVHFAYYLVAGFAWTLPAMAIIKWMRRAPKPEPR
jgi:membrane protease YdiL (CAAX protease family)